MKLSGNANAKNFFLQHGVTATQMEVSQISDCKFLDVIIAHQSEKKYKTKAATEYRRHLTKLLEGEHHSGRGHLDEDDIVDTKEKEEDLSGIDGLMRSMASPSSGDGKPPRLERASTEPGTVFRSPQPVHAPVTSAPAPAAIEVPVSPAPIRTPSPATPIGTLSVRAATKPVDESSTTAPAEGTTTPTTHFARCLFLMQK